MNFSFLAGTALFRGISKDEIEAMMVCLNAKEREYKKGDVILRAGDTTSCIGLIERGSVNISVSFYWGGSNILGHFGVGDIFAENYAAIPSHELNCDVLSAEDTKVLFLDMKNLLGACSNNCGFHRRLIQNLLKIGAVRSLKLSSRMMHIAPKSIRERLLSFFSELSSEAGSLSFTIPFTRQQLADYLSVDRSALSNELGKMRRDGLIEVDKNKITLIKTDF